MKKFISLVLVFTMIFTFTTAVFAQNYNSELLKNEKEKYKLAMAKLEKQYAENPELLIILKQAVTESYNKRINLIKKGKEPSYINLSKNDTGIMIASMSSEPFARYSYTETVKERKRTTTYIMTEATWAVGICGFATVKFPLAAIPGMIALSFWKIAQIENIKIQDFLDDARVYAIIEYYWTDEANYEYRAYNTETWKYDGKILQDYYGNKAEYTTAWDGDWNE